MAPDLQNRPDQQSDPIQRSYDTEFSQLTNPAHYNKNADDPQALKQAEERGSLFNPAGDKTTAAGSAVGALAAKERNVGGGVGKSLYNPIGQSSPLGAMRALLSRNKGKGAAVGGGITALILVLAFGIGSVATFELETIEKNLVADVSKMEKHFERKRAQRTFQRTMQRTLRRLHGTKAEQAKIAAESAAGGELAQAMDNFDVTSPEVVGDLAKAGITVETDGAGNFSGLKDAAGKDITNSIGTNDVAFNEIEAALPEWDVGQIESFRTLMVDHANASFRGIPENTPPEDVNKVIQNSVENGASESELRAAASEEARNNQSTDPNAPADPTTAANDATAAKEGGAIGDAINATDKALQSGATTEAAIQTGVDAVNLGNPLLAAGLATTACAIKKDVDEASRSRVPKIMKLLIRHMTFIASASQEVHSGKIKGATMAKLMTLYNGDSRVQPDLRADPKHPNQPIDPYPTAAMPFSQSAAWQRISGGVVNTNKKQPGFTPDISLSSRPTANAGTKIVNEIDTITNDTGVSAACGALTSKYGFAVQGVLGLVQIASDIGSIGVNQVAMTAGIIALQESIRHFVLPEIIRYFTPLGLNGLEQSVQLMNNNHAGGLLAFHDYARRLGASPLSNSDTRKLVAAANQDLLNEQAGKSWTARTFAFDNPHSLTARLAVTLPTSNRQLMVGFASFFTDLPHTLTRTFSSIFFMRKASADGFGTDSESAYGITAYGFTDAEINRYPDADTNEQYLKGTVTYVDRSDPKNPKTYTGVRLALAGDPNAYESGSNIDPNGNDLLHCFVNSFDTSAYHKPGDPPDPICASVGNFDYEVTSPQPMDDNNVAYSYCMGLIGTPSSDCISQITSQLQDDIGHFRQYILDVHIMHDYTSLATNS